MRVVLLARLPLLHRELLPLPLVSDDQTYDTAVQKPETKFSSIRTTLHHYFAIYSVVSFSSRRRLRRLPSNLRFDPLVAAL